ncbi:MAG: hypothetical protein SVO01_11215, partial [Thermotogota bacterium]|nr:hypothetical protein [Thermotogota bacterium]
MKRVWKSLFMLSVAFIVPTVLLADSITMEDVVRSIDTMWTLLAAFLVFFMQAGFALVEAGFTRSKNTVNIIMKNFTDFLVGSILYWLIGFTIMFGLGNGFIGWQGSFEYLGLNIPFNAFLIFQTVFAATAATIVSGAMAERTKFTGYLIYSVFISAFIYPIVGHWNTSVKMATLGVEGMGYAISMHSAEPIIEDLISQGYVATRPWLGV